MLMQADTEEGQAACDELGVDVLPTLQFYKDGNKLWEHRGHLQLQQDLGEGVPSAYNACWPHLPQLTPYSAGVLYYGGSAAGGLKAGEFITDLDSRQDLDTFVNAQSDKVLGWHVL